MAACTTPDLGRIKKVGLFLADDCLNPIYGAAAGYLFEADIPTPVALVLGAEGSGLAPIVRKRCQMVLSIPMLGHVDSLNAATAAC